MFSFGLVMEQRSILSASSVLCKVITWFDIPYLLPYLSKPVTHHRDYNLDSKEVRP